MKGMFMQRGSTMFLRATLLVMGLIVLVICAFVLPAIHREWAGEFTQVAFLRYPVLLVLGAAACSFFVALYQAWRLLDYIDANTAFSASSVTALRNIKYCGFVMSGLFAAVMPFVYSVAEQDDAPGLILIGMFFAAAPMVVAVFAAVVQRLLQNAIAIKSENDLTV